MRGIKEYCPEEKCSTDLIYYEEEFGLYRCYKCRKIFSRPKIVKKEFKTINMFGDEDERLS